jgi:hypothetical protein
MLMSMTSNLNSQLFDFSDIDDVDGLVSKIDADLSVFSVDGFVFKLVSNYSSANPVFDYLSGGQHAVCEEYNLRHWSDVDPFFIYAQKSIVPFSNISTDDLTDLQVEMLQFLNKNGYENYYVIPLHSPYGAGVRFAAFYLWSKMSCNHDIFNLHNLSAMLISYGYFVFNFFVVMRGNYFMKLFGLSDVDIQLVRMYCNGSRLADIAMKLNIKERVLGQRLISVANVFASNGEPDFIRASVRFMLV